MPSRKELANAIRVLSMDAVEKAKSGHPGMPMGMADIAEVLWQDFLSHNPQDPNWSNRDRFILSNGHGSMLHYALLHLTGYELSIDDLKNFRQFESKTPGHPEVGYTPGVETTTGPLGQGLANVVGMALAEKILAAQFNRENFPIVDHYTYVFAGDGCLMEGLSHEVCSLAGTWKLGKLICFYDDNGISIDGEIEPWFSDDTPKRFAAYGWQVIENIDGHDSEALLEAIKLAQSEQTKPTIICCKTVIGHGAPNAAGGHQCHGAPLGESEIQASREFLNWEHGAFDIPESIYQAWDHKERGTREQSKWLNLFTDYTKAYPELAKEYERRMSGQLPQTWDACMAELLENMQNSSDSMASRKASLLCLNHIGPELPELIGGSADLTGSNLTAWQDCETFFPEHHEAGNYIHYGVREFGMCAINNGIALYGGFIPYGGTFLVFLDYARNAVRMAALMKQRNIFVFTHDSIGLGEDGPTHQPIEHAAMLRATPNMSTWRPCDQVESAVAWQAAIERQDGPTSLLFSRQGLAKQQRDNKQLVNIKRGGYILRDCEGKPDCILISTGSEVEITMAAAELLSAMNIQVRVVSMPSTDVFDKQDREYQNQVLPQGVNARIAIEAGASSPWYKYVGLHGAVISIDKFGESAPYKDLYQHFGFSAENIKNTVVTVLEKLKK